MSSPGNGSKVPSRLLDDIEEIQDLLVEAEAALDKILLRGGLTEEARAELSDLVSRIREHPLVVQSSNRVARATQLAGGPS